MLIIKYIQVIQFFFKFKDLYFLVSSIFRSAKKWLLISTIAELQNTHILIKITSNSVVKVQKNNYRLGHTPHFLGLTLSSHISILIHGRRADCGRRFCVTFADNCSSAEETEAHKWKPADGLQSRSGKREMELILIIWINLRLLCSVFVQKDINCIFT